MIFYTSAIVLGLCLTAMGLGIFITMRIFKIPDITTDGSYTLGASVTAILLTTGWSWWAIIPITLIAGALAGSITGWIHTRLGVDALLAGILVMTGLYSVNLTILGRSNVPLNETDNLFSSLKFIENPLFSQLIIVMGVCLLLIFLVYVLLRTDFGIAMRATGDSETMTESLGINNAKMKTIGLSIANALTAFSGFLLAQFQLFADINMGIGIVLTGLGSVLIGNTLGNLFQHHSIFLQLIWVAIGAIAFQVLLATAISIGINPNLLKLITAVFVLGIVGIPKLISKT
ncbi:MAG: ABC transporter permease [Saprospiraceae bacterium]|jgi:putative ABC transport system permease protein